MTTTADNISGKQTTFTFAALLNNRLILYIMVGKYPVVLIKIIQIRDKWFQVNHVLRLLLFYFIDRINPNMSLQNSLMPGNYHDVVMMFIVVWICAATGS